MERKNHRTALLAIVSLFASSFLAVNASNPPSQSSHYILHEGSSMVDECPICGRPTIEQPMRGSFELRWLVQGPLFTEYAIENVDFTAGSPSSRFYTIKGNGHYRIGGEVASVQQMTLAVTIDDGFTNKLCYFTNEPTTIERLWPMISIVLRQTNATLTQEYTLTLDASPLREIWFSTVAGMTSANRPAPTNHISGGDLLAMDGRVVKSNHDLTARLGIMPIAPDVGLDALDILPGGEIAFSIEQDQFSETLGPLQHGDLLSNKGVILRSNQQLMAAFQLTSSRDVGLDAVQVLDSGEIYFSIETNAVTSKSVSLGHGDLLSDAGRVVKRNWELVARFHPSNTNVDYWLDALYVWPSGEIWFSVEQGFTSTDFQTYAVGDLLSDQGYVVFRNLELVSAFAPIEDLADFGLDALFIVTDVSAPATAPQFTNITRNGQQGTMTLEWTGGGRVWQLLGSTNIPGHFNAHSPIMPDSSFEEAPSAKALFYLLRQW